MRTTGPLTAGQLTARFALGQLVILWLSTFALTGQAPGVVSHATLLVLLAVYSTVLDVSRRQR
jgi:hypothetical protein